MELSEWTTENRRTGIIRPRPDFEERARLRRERMTAARSGETYVGYCPRCNDGTECTIVNRGKQKGLYCSCTRRR